MTGNIKYKKYNTFLNLSLLEKNDKLDNLKELKKVYVKLFKIFEKMELTDDRIKLFNYNLSIEELEYQMQELWGFEKNRNMHRYWVECPKCTCPKLDNLQSRGSIYRIYNCDCLIHGNLTRKIIQRKRKLERILSK
jgi:hypothetical protein